MNVLRSKRAVAGLGAALVSIVGLTLFVVLPALASNSGDRIPPAATSGLTPVDVPVGGNATCSSLFGSKISSLPNLHEYDNVNPGNATGLSSGNGDGVTFSTTVTGSSKAQVMQVSATKAAIAGIGIKGGSESAAYDYTGLSISPGVTTGWVCERREPARNCIEVHGQRWGGEPVPVVQHQPDDRLLSRPRPDLGHGVHRRERQRLNRAPARPASAAVNVTIVDNTTHGQTTVTTAANGTFSSPPAGRRLVHGVLRVTRLRLPAVGSDLGRSLPWQPDRLRLPGSFDRLDHELLRVPAARLGRRHGLQRREPGSDQQRRLAARRAGPSRSTAERSRCRRRRTRDGSYKINAAFSTSTTVHAVRDAAERHLGPGRAPALDHDHLRPEPERERGFGSAE